MKDEHIEKLVDISNCCRIDLGELVKTYSNKQSQYIKRENKTNIDWLDIQNVYGDRAINVMETYAKKYLCYK